MNMATVTKQILNRKTQIRNRKTLSFPARFLRGESAFEFKRWS